MKIIKLSLISLLAIFITMQIISCEKKAEEKSKDIEIIVNNEGGFEFYIEDGKISFTTLDDYDKAIQFLCADEKHNDYFINNGFISFGSSTLPINCDEILGALLNENGEIIIKEILFKFDFDTNELKAINSEKSTTRIFSFDEDVLTILFPEEFPDVEGQLKSTEACNAREKNEDWIYESDIHMKYNRAGIYYWLVGELNCGNNQQIAVMTVHNETCCYKSTNDLYKQVEGDEESSNGGQTARITVYQGMRRLNTFYFKASFDLYDLERNNLGSTWVDLGCFCGNCGCVETW